MKTQNPALHATQIKKIEKYIAQHKDCTFTETIKQDIIEELRLRDKYSEIRYFDISRRVAEKDKNDVNDKNEWTSLTYLIYTVNSIRTLKFKSKGSDNWGYCQMFALTIDYNDGSQDEYYYALPYGADHDPYGGRVGINTIGNMYDAIMMSRCEALAKGYHTFKEYEGAVLGYLDRATNEETKKDIEKPTNNPTNNPTNEPTKKATNKPTKKSTKKVTRKVTEKNDDESD